MMGVKVEVEIGELVSSRHPVSNNMGKHCHESSICLEGKGTHNGAGIKKKQQ